MMTRPRIFSTSSGRTVLTLVAGLLLVACTTRRAPPPAPYAPPPPGYGPPPQGPPPAIQPAPPGAQPGPPPAAAQLPAPVRATLDQYVQILASSRSLEECVQRFTPIAGGGLVNEDGRSLRATVPPYSLKKDWQNVRFYAQPAQVTRVDVKENRADGYGPSAIRGTEYKVWIAKAQGQPGMPAPISFMVPDQHPFVQGPRVVGIGSL